MAWIKRIALFFAVNTLVIVSVSLILNLLNVKPYLQNHGIDYQSLLIFCTVWGFAGALISLSLSRVMAKKMMGVHLVDEDAHDPKALLLVQTVKKLCKSAYLSDIPEIGIYESAEINAFATGPTKKRSLIAVSRGLLNRMSAQELEGVLGHEIAHITNGDMVTMTLVQGVVNAFVMFFARVIAYTLSQMMDKNSKGKSSYRSYYMYTFFVAIFEVIFMFLGMIIIATYSRFREFRADKGGALIAGKSAMISALKALKNITSHPDPQAQKPAFDTMKINVSAPSKLQKLLATHPSLDVRIERLNQSFF